MKKLSLFMTILLSGLMAHADAPSIERIAQAYFQYIGVQVQDLEVNELEDVFTAGTDKEIFFRTGGIYYNCTLSVPSVRANPQFGSYDVRGFGFDNCQNYDNGQSVMFTILGSYYHNRSNRFEAGVAFYNHNRQFMSTAEYYSEERIGRSPGSRR